MPTIRLSLADLGLTERMGTSTQRERRIPFRLDIEIQGDNQRCVGRTYNIAVRGVAVYVEPETEIQVGMRVGISSHDLFNAWATVIWRKDGQKDHRGEDVVAFGLAFETEAELGGLENLVSTYRPTVLLVDDQGSNITLVQEALQGAYYLSAVPNAQAALAVLDRFEVAILITELDLPGMSGQALIAEIERRFPCNRIVQMVMTDYIHPNALQEFVEAQNIFYFLQKPLSRADLATIVGSAGSEYFQRVGRDERQDLGSSDVEQRILEHSSRLAIQRDVGSTSAAATEAIVDLVRATRAYCNIYDPVTEKLWCLQPNGEERLVATASSLTGFVARTGKAVRLASAADTRYVPKIDDPLGPGLGKEPFVAVPVQSPDRKVLAVLSALRSPGDTPFSEKDEATLASLAAQAVSAFSRARLQANLEHLFRDREPDTSPLMFRAEAFEQYYDKGKRRGEVLQVSPRWILGSYWVLLGLFAVFLGFGFVAEISDVTRGPALVMAEEKTRISATSAGTVSNIYIKPGQRVEPNQKLIELHASSEGVELARVEGEFRTQLARSLQDPRNKEIETSLTSLRTERDLLRARLEERTIRAPKAGVISDVRVRMGQQVEPGASLASFVNQNSRYYLIALIDGEHRPLLKVGTPLKLEFKGYRYAYETLYIESVSEEILGPVEAREYLGGSLGSMQIDRPVSVVKAFLSDPSFKSRGRSLRIHAGMSGVVELKLRSKPVYTLFIPGYME